MNLFRLGARQAPVLWLDAHQLQAAGQVRPHAGLPTDDDLAQALSNLPSGPSAWILDDALVPSLILRDVLEAPAGAEARDAFFSWKFGQSLGLETPHAVQSLPLGEASWLLVGLPTALRDGWLSLAGRLGRPIHKMIPRWLWLYNRLAPGREKPGMLLSLSGNPDAGYTGSLVAWGRHLVQLRQWQEAASQDVWIEERIRPTVAYLTRESRTPQELWVWGARDWPRTELETQVLSPEIPQREVL